MDSDVEKAVDSICALGCQVVSDYIVALKQRQLRPEYQSLDTQQRDSLLQILQSVMSAYDNR